MGPIITIQVKNNHQKGLKLFTGKYQIITILSLKALDASRIQRICVHFQ